MMVYLSGIGDVLCSDYSKATYEKDSSGRCLLKCNDGTGAIYDFSNEKYCSSMRPGQSVKALSVFSFLSPAPASSALGRTASSASGSSALSAASGGSQCSDPAQWEIRRTPEGKCYNICFAEGIIFEIEPQYCIGARTLSQSQIATEVSRKNQPQGDWFSKQTIVAGIPNWMVALGGVAVVALVMNN